MYRIPPEPLELGLLRGPRLSRRRVRKLIRVRQHWHDAEGQAWQVLNVHRKDGIAHLYARIEERNVHLFIPFAHLARHYRLTEAETP